MDADTIREAVRERYAGKALEMAKTGCCDDGCGTGYDAAELAALGLTPEQSLGCGVPTLVADIRPGEIVLDLGSGAGLDVLLSARRVGAEGHAYGVDMTDEMLALARANQERAGVRNATFLKGTLEALPLPDASVDVIVSNCVINLAADKRRVLREAARVLRPGGRFAVSDMVALSEIGPEAKARLDSWAGCVAGTITTTEYEAALREAGFGDIGFELANEVRIDDVDAAIASAYIRARKEATA